MLEDSGGHQVHLLPLQYVDQAHLLFYRIKELPDLLLIPLHLRVYVQPALVALGLPLLHDLELQVVEGLGKRVYFYLLLREGLLDLVLLRLY